MDDPVGWLGFTAYFIVCPIVLWTIIFPINTLFHEGGHALAALALTDANVKLSLGFEKKGLDFRIGRLSFHASFFTGFFGHTEYSQTNIAPVDKANNFLCWTLHIFTTVSSLLEHTQFLERRVRRVETSACFICQLLYFYIHHITYPLST